MILFNNGITSKDGRGQAMDNIFVGQLLRIMKC